MNGEIEQIFNETHDGGSGERQQLNVNKSKIKTVSAEAVRIPSQTEMWILFGEEIQEPQVGGESYEAQLGSYSYSRHFLQ
jgi:hypothetical protein